MWYVAEIKHVHKYVNEQLRNLRLGISLQVTTSSVQEFLVFA